MKKQMSKKPLQGLRGRGAEPHTTKSKGCMYWDLGFLLIRRDERNGV